MSIFIRRSYVLSMKKVNVKKVLVANLLMATNNLEASPIFSRLNFAWLFKEANAKNQLINASMLTVKKN